jgi:hypothetical protein
MLHTPEADETPRVLVHRCYSWRDARRAFDVLRVGFVPERRIVVRARGLSWVRPLSRAAAARRAAVVGAVGGALIGGGLRAFGLIDAGVAVGIGALVAALLGAGAAALTIVAAQRTSRAEAVVPDAGHLEAEVYEIAVEPDYVDKARRVLSA